MSSTYRVNVKNQEGVLVGIIDNWITMTFSRVLNGVGTLTLTLDGDNDKIPLFELDGQIEVWRTTLDLDWYLEWEGFYRGQHRSVADSGEKIIELSAYTYTHLLTRRIIAYRETTSYTDKSDAAETVLKEFVNENAGAGATNPPRLGNGVITGLNIDSDNSLGGLWSGSKAFKSLFETCVEISQANHIDFDIVGMGAAQFAFKTYYPYRGADRTITGLVRSTGLNASGNVPVIFELAWDRLQNVDYTNDRSAEVNRVYVLGAGEQQNLLVEVVDDSNAIAESTWNQCESSQSATSETTSDALTLYGVSALYELKGVETLEFTALQQPGLVYGKDYFFGDIVTAIYDDVIVNKKIISVSITCDSQNNDSIELGFDDAN